MEIHIENQQVKTEFLRWCDHFGDHDPYTKNGNIGIRDVLRAHFLIADYFYEEGYGMGGIGPREPNLLHSAVYRQFDLPPVFRLPTGGFHATCFSCD